MNRNFRLLNFLVKKGVIDLKDFYVISFRDSEIHLQGTYRPDKVMKYSNGNKGIDSNGYVQITNNPFCITLTN